MLRSLFSVGKQTVRFISTKNQTTYNVATALGSHKLEILERKSREEALSKPENWDTALPYDQIPGPKPLPIIGNLWRFAPYIGDLHGLGLVDFLNKFKEYGDVCVLRNVLGKDQVFVFNAEDIEYVYRNEGVWPIRKNFESTAYYREHVRTDQFKKLDVLAGWSGKEWQEQRTMANPILSQSRSVEMYIPEINDVVDEFMGRIRFLMKQNNNEMPEDFVNEISKWTLESVGVITLDKRLGCLVEKPTPEVQKFINAVHILLDALFQLEFKPSLWKLYSTRDWKNLVYALDTICDTYKREILEAKQKRELDPSVNKNSIFQRLLDVNEEFAMNMAVTILTAGVDTTTTSASGALYLLATNKRPQEELRKELKELLPHKDSPFTKEKLAKAKYLKAVVKESQRIAGIAFGNMREATKDLVVGGYQIPKGTLINLVNYYNMFSEEQFPHPEEFLPERWLRSNNEEYFSHKKAHPFSYLPFGFGPRTCLGKNIALMEMETLLAKLIRNFEITWPHPPATFQAKMLYSIKDPLRFKMKEVDD